MEAPEQKKEFNLIQHPLGENQLCPYCNNIIKLIRNFEKDRNFFSLWKCTKCGHEFIEVIFAR